MNRSKIEQVKAIVVTAFAIVMLLLIISIHDYTMVWIPIILGALAGWFWWKASYFSGDGD